MVDVLALQERALGPAEAKSRVAETLAAWRRNPVTDCCPSDRESSREWLECEALLCVAYEGRIGERGVCRILNWAYSRAAWAYADAAFIRHGGSYDSLRYLAWTTRRAVALAFEICGEAERMSRAEARSRLGLPAEDGDEDLELCVDGAAALDLFDGTFVFFKDTCDFS